ncbi:MAG TPA: type I pantothenate kinase [Phycicoccus elongatus]|jgi:type I pantothenate kinase|nr:MULTISPECIES: type I pantothenate kinase [Phycicoccus]MCB1239779.1 type I pantothenate kinase [Tetrasphaera sp.]MCB9406767.1 type I pantothenate kinase [Tetrasphaera sp.]HOA65921.1 type I pantothenate kinase [Phycicoccus elongatus]HPK11471.1 type I pantothenate kinase [Phycicoccus elongatus]HRV57232.1 type I pantothenate kinase [Phycicoccus sp.]
MTRVALTDSPTGLPSPYAVFGRTEWARLSESHPMNLTGDDLTRLRGLGEPVDLDEVESVYLPLSRLLYFYVEATHGLRLATSEFLGERPTRVPFVVGVAGSVAVGKSTTARILRELMLRWPHTPRVELVTTDGFLYPNKVLEERGLLQRKGFPESYDRRALLKFVADVKSGELAVEARQYSHLTYDVLPATVTIRKPDVLIVEGLNVLQPPTVRSDGTNTGSISDFFDFSVYVDADLEDIRRWYVERFLRLRQTAFADPKSYFHRYAALSDAQARATATDIWTRINEPNLIENIEPTKGRATLVLAKGSDHSVETIKLRKL